ncbi:MAG: Glutamyl-tRNA reductase [Anaerolineales bacterium]|nr:Glutamyl-tRNA reductase [Anaerolineales bacterium]
MHLICVGLSHHTATVELRERLALSGGKLRAGLMHLRPADADPPLDIHEAVVLNTCNRLEVYGLAQDAEAGIGRISEFLSEFHGVPTSSFAPHLYTYRDEEVAHHLFRVAAGLDSMIVGESEVLGQVREAHEVARGHGAAGQVTTKLFDDAVRAGRRVRHETVINERPASVPSAAVRLARELHGSLTGANVLVVGAGEMGALTAKALMNRGADGIIVSNRSYPRAVQLSNEWDGCAVTFDRLTEALAEVDIVISATGAPHPVIMDDMVSEAMTQRRHRPLLIIDIAVPRDVEPDVAEIAGVTLHDIDDLTCRVDHNLEQRRAEVPEAEAIVAGEADCFMAWFNALDVVPTIVDLRQQAEAVREAEVDRALRQLRDLSEEEQEVVEILSKRIINKLLHEPTVRLKHHANGHSGFYYTETLRELFALDEAI